MTVLLLPEQLESRAKISSSTLAKMRVRGDGPPFVKIGAKVLYPEEEFEAWLAARPRLRSTSEVAAGTGGRRGRKAAEASTVGADLHSGA